MLFGSRTVLAAVKVGDTPTFAFKALDGTEIKSESLRGKIVVVDFWATWCPVCMKEAGHIVEINKSYSPQGVQLIGINMDKDIKAAVKVAKEKEFTWPQDFDGKEWKTPLAVACDFDSLPFVMILGPDGKVLWKGSPVDLDGPLKEAVKNHPPHA